MLLWRIVQGLKACRRCQRNSQCLVLPATVRLQLCTFRCCSLNFFSLRVIWSTEVHSNGHRRQIYWLYRGELGLAREARGRGGGGALAQTYLHGVSFQQYLALLRLVGVHSLSPLQGLQILPICDHHVHAQPNKTGLNKQFLLQPSLQTPWDSQSANSTFSACRLTLPGGTWPRLNNIVSIVTLYVT